MKKIQIIKNNDDRAEREPLINIITRTAGRPNFFDNNYNSICNQNYSNYKHWVIYDEQKTYKDYLRYYHDIELVKVDKQEVQQRDDIKHPNTGGRFFYNLYFNDAISQIKDGWILILDDDDAFAHTNVLKKIANLLKYKSDMAIFQMKYLNGKLLPDAPHFYKKPMLGSIGSPCVVVHHKYAKMHKWDGWKCADFRYINACWKNTSRKVWIKEPMISIGSMNGNFGKKNDIKINKKKEELDFVIGIPTYNRPKMLSRLLKQLDDQKGDIKYKIIVLDDASKFHDENKKNVDLYNNVIIQKNRVNQNKKGYWRTFNSMLNYANNFLFSHFIQIDDDFLLCEDFLSHMKSISEKHPQKFVKYIRDQSSDKNRWGFKKWVDGGTMIPYSFLKRTSFKINPINNNRWNINENLSSGVWSQISSKINMMGYDVIHTKISYAKHLGYDDSRMNKKIRSKHNIKTINFKDDE